MHPDWYVDPLGRYEGRYWDGEQWTDQVKDRGHLATDPDWPPHLIDPSGAHDGSAPAAEVGPMAESDAASAAPTGGPGTEEPVIASIGDVDVPPSPVAFRAAGQPIEVGAATVDNLVDDESAVAEIDLVTGRTVDYSSESPTRQVAVLEPIGKRPADAAVEVPEPTTSASGRRWLYAIGAGVLLVGILLALLPRLSGSDAETTDAIDDDGVVDDVDPRSGGVEDDGIDEPDPGVQIGALRVLNAAEVLDELEAWHPSEVARRDLEPVDGAGCWLGTIGEAMVQQAHCGPVGFTDDGEALFDLVPLRFEDDADGVISIDPLIDAVVPDAVLSNGLLLVDAAGDTLDPADFDRTVPPTRPTPTPDNDTDDAPDDQGGVDDASGDDGDDEDIDPDDGDDDPDDPAPYNDVTGGDGDDDDRGSRGERTDGS